MPNCAECYTNIGTVQHAEEDYDEAEAAYKKAIEVKPDSADAYIGLANLYNAEKKFDQAAEASKKAMKLAARRRAAPAAAATPSAVFNQGVIALERRQDSRSEDAVRAGRASSTRRWPKRTTGSAWRIVNGGKHAGGDNRLRGVPEARADGPVRRQAKSILAHQE